MLGYTVLTAAGAIVLWMAAWGLAWWITLFLLTAVFGDEARPPAHFQRNFLLVAGGGLALASLRHWATRDERPRDHRGAWEIVLDIVLTIPRVTLAVWGNLSAWPRLKPEEEHEAARLLERLTERRILLATAPQEIGDDRRREHILYTLQLIGLTEIRREEGEYWLQLVKPPPGEALRV